MMKRCPHDSRDLYVCLKYVNNFCANRSSCAWHVSGFPGARLCGRVDRTGAVLRVMFREVKVALGVYVS